MASPWQEGIWKWMGMLKDGIVGPCHAPKEAALWYSPSCHPGALSVRNFLFSCNQHWDLLSTRSWQNSFSFGRGRTGTGIISNFPLVSTLHTCRAALHPAPIRTQSLQESITQQMPGRVCSVLGLCWRLGSAVNRWSLMLALVPHGGLGLGFSTSHSHTPALVNEVFL